MKVVFMGSPAFAVPSLQALIDSRHEVLAVFTQEPKPAGRGQHLSKTPVHQLAEAHNIQVFTPKKLTAEVAEQLKALQPDAICVAAYGKILPQSVLAIAPCVNVHPSALPRWRGAAPLNHTLLAGDTTTELCIMKMEAGLDDGPVYLRHKVTIEPNETAGDLHDRMAALGAACLAKVLAHFGAYQKQLKKQPWWKRATYAHKFKPADLPQIRALDFAKKVQEVHNQVRGLSPWPGATCTLQGVELKVLRSSVVANMFGTPGQVMAADAKNGLIVACKYGALRLQEVQRPGKKAMADTELLKSVTFEVAAAAAGESCCGGHNHKHQHNHAESCCGGASAKEQSCCGGHAGKEHGCCSEPHAKPKQSGGCCGGGHGGCCH